MSTGAKTKTTVKVTDFWECKRCNINSNTKGRMIPCPRGSCEADIIGTKKIQTTITITFNKNEPQ